MFSDLGRRWVCEEGVGGEVWEVAAAWRPLQTGRESSYR